MLVILNRMRRHTGEIAQLHAELVDLCGVQLMDIVACILSHKDALLKEFQDKGSMVWGAASSVLHSNEPLAVANLPPSNDPLAVVNLPPSNEPIGVPCLPTSNEPLAVGSLPTVHEPLRVASQHPRNEPLLVSSTIKAPTPTQVNILEDFSDIVLK